MMNRSPAPTRTLLLSAVMPDFVEELRQKLILTGEPALAGLVSQLKILSRCECMVCGSFYTSNPPRGAFGAGHRNVLLGQTGLLVLDVVPDSEGIERIHFVEVLGRDDVRTALDSVLPPTSDAFETDPIPISNLLSRVGRTR